jgi:hypothetical protein
MQLKRGGFALLIAGTFAAACGAPAPQEAPAEGAATAAPAQSPAERGEYLVHLGGCHDCHSPKNFTDAGPVPDTTRLLAGHTGGGKLPAVPANVIGPEGWGALASNDFTAWAGPWGVSFSRNLTPDQATGLGSWTEAMFIQTIRDGKHQGTGRPLLPPMPWQEYRNLTDDDLRAIWAYLQSIPAVNNAVPEPVPPAGPPPAR